MYWRVKKRCLSIVLIFLESKDENVIDFCCEFQGRQWDCFLLEGTELVFKK